MDREWDIHQRKIWHLYLVENKPLKAVMEEFEGVHGFARPKKDWIDKLKAWGCVKNLNKDGWRYVGHQARKRKNPSSSSTDLESVGTGRGEDRGGKVEGAGAHVVLAGVRLSGEQLEKGIRNHCPGPRLKMARQRSPSPQLPWGIPLQVYTPPPLAAVSWPQTLPWLQFHSNGAFQAITSILERVHRPNQQQALITTQGPQVLTPDLINILNNAMKALGTTVITTPNSNSSSTKQPPPPPSSIHARLSLLMPETTPDEHLVRAESLSRQQGSHWAAITWLEIAFFVYSNHLDSFNSKNSKEVNRSVLGFFEGLLSLPGTSRGISGSEAGIVRTLVTSEAPTAVALVDRFFASAVRLRRLDVLRHLFDLVEPKDSNEQSGFQTSTSSILMRNRARKGIKDVDSRQLGEDVVILPIDYALRVGDEEMADFLLEKGARFSFNASSSRSTTPISLLEEDGGGGGKVIEGDEVDVVDYGSSLDSAFTNLAISNIIRRYPPSDVPHPLACRVFDAQRERFSEESIIAHLSRIPIPGIKGGGKTWFTVATMMLDQLWEMDLFGDDLKSPLAVLVLAIRFRHLSMVKGLLEAKKNTLDINAVWDPIGKSEPSYVTALAEAAWTTCASKETHMEMDLCTLLLDRGASPDPVDNNALSALQVAAHCGNLSLASLLVERGADVNYSFYSNIVMVEGKPLRAAIERNHPAMVEFLLGRGAQVSAEDLVDIESRSTTRDGGSMMKRLVSSGVFSPSNLLQVAARRGDLNIAKSLVKLGADVAYETDNGETALSLALSIGHLPLANWFLEQGITRYDAAALLAAATKPEYNTFFNIAFQSRNRGTPWTAYLEGLTLATAVCLGDQDRVEMLLKAGISMVERNPRESEGEFIFRFRFNEANLVEVISIGSDSREDHILVIPHGTLVGTACVAQQPAIVKILLQHGYRPNHVDLAMAARKLDLETVKQLLAAMPPPSSASGSNIDGILATLIDRGWIVYVNSLLDNLRDSINVNIPETPVPIVTGTSIRLPLQSAIVAEDVKLVTRLIEMGADLNPPLSTTAGWSGSTSSPLRTAAAYGSIGIVSLLVEKGADCNAPGVRFIGGTALEAAAEYGRVDIVQYLLSAAEVKTTEGRHRRQYFRAIRLAEDEGHHLVAKLLKEHREWSDEDWKVFETTHSDDFSDVSDLSVNGVEQVEGGTGGSDDGGLFSVADLVDVGWDELLVVDWEDL